VAIHVEVVVYGDPEVLDFSDFMYAFYVLEWETSLCSPVGALYSGAGRFFPLLFRRTLLRSSCRSLFLHCGLPPIVGLPLAFRSVAGGRRRRG